MDAHHGPGRKWSRHGGVGSVAHKGAEVILRISF
jgi:hypothetical protein